MSAGTEHRTRVLALGIDAANPDLLRAWAADGTLPNLGALMARGVSGPLRSLEGFFVGSTWPSLYTGVTPAKHGFHFQVQLRPGSYTYHWPEDGELVLREPFWRHLGRAGHRVAVLDVPLAKLDPGIEGVHVVEWGSHDAVYGFRSSPAALEADLRDRFGEHPLGTSCDGIRSSAEEYEALIDALLRGVRGKAAMTADLLGQGGWDFFIQVFTESHCVGHQCWHLGDATHPAHDPEIARRVGNPLKRVYRAIDEALGEVIAQAGDAKVFVFSGHGMGHWYGAQFLLPEILVRLGVAARPAPRRLRSAARGSAVWAWRRIPRPVRRLLIPPLRKVFPSPEGVRRAPSWAVRPEASRCFPVSNGLAVGGIRINRSGREPEGLVEPGADEDALCEALTADLLDVVDDRTGAPAVRRVLRTRDHFQGDRVDDLPDLLIEWDDAVATGSTLVAGGAGASVRLRSPKIGVVEGLNEYGRTGEHRVEGLFVAAGPGIRAGRLDGAVSVLDLAPTFAAALGVELPDCDGRPIREALP